MGLGGSFEIIIKIFAFFFSYFLALASGQGNSVKPPEFPLWNTAIAAFLEKFRREKCVHLDNYSNQMLGVITPMMAKHSSERIPSFKQFSESLVTSSNFIGFTRQETHMPCGQSTWTKGPVWRKKTYHWLLFKGVLIFKLSWFMSEYKSITSIFQDIYIHFHALHYLNCYLTFLQYR